METSKVVLYIAMSLDSYIARPDGSVDWLFDVEGDGGDNGYAKFYETIGTVVMGRLTYDEVLKLSDEFPYAGKPCYVMTRSATRSDDSDVKFTNETVDTLIPKLKEASSGDVWIVGGGQIIRECLEKEMIDEVHIAVIPKVLGEGISLFPTGTLPSTFRLFDVEILGQIVMLKYETVKK
jgi:dihydrofolate reductase